MKGSLLAPVLPWDSTLPTFQGSDTIPNYEGQWVLTGLHFSFLFFSLLSCRCYFEVQLICLFVLVPSVQCTDSVMTYT